jgi:adhesin/invasin
MFRDKCLLEWMTPVISVLLILGLFWAACTKKTPMDPTQSLQDQIMLLTGMQAAPARINTGGESAAISVRLIDQDDNSVRGQIVRFASNLGTVIPDSAITGSDGMAQTTLTSGAQAGEAAVTARVGRNITAGITVEFVSSADSQEGLSIWTNRNSILADGTDTTMVWVAVREGNDQPVQGASVTLRDEGNQILTQLVTGQDGTAGWMLRSIASAADTSARITAVLDSVEVHSTVSFRGVNLSLSVNPRSILADGESRAVVTAVVKETTSHIAISGRPVIFSTDLGLIPNQAQTNEAGVAQTFLTSARDTGTAEITARFGNELRQTDTVRFSREAPSQNALHKLEIDNKTLLANGMDQASVTATVYDASGQPVQGENVFFTASAGASISLAAVTSSNGQASVIFTAPSSVRDTVSVVRAYLDGQEEDAFEDIIHCEGITMFLREPVPDEILADGQAESEITVIVKRTTSNVGVQGARIYFGTNLGSIPNSAETNSSGIARVSLTSDLTPDTARVVASYGPVMKDTVYVPFLETAPAYLNVSASPPAITADGVSASQITASVSNINRNPVPNGTLVRFSLRGSGTLERQKTTVNGTAASTLVSGTSPDTVTVIITVADLTDSVQVVYSVGNAHTVLVTSNRDSIRADGQENAQIRARVLDAQATPIRNATVYFSTNIGDITFSSQTNDGGYAFAQFSSGTVGTAIVTATVNLSTGGSVSGSATVIITPGAPNSIVLKF